MNKQKQKILEIIKNTYCRIKPSKIEGVGIFAIRDIPKGKNPFLGVQKHTWYDFTPNELKNLDKEIKKMIGDFWAADEKGNFSIPDVGLNGIDISFFLNASSKPNVKTIDDGTHFKTIKKIKKGEELTTSYADYDARYR